MNIFDKAKLKRQYQPLDPRKAAEKWLDLFDALDKTFDNWGIDQKDVPLDPDWLGVSPMIVIEAII